MSVNDQLSAGADRETGHVSRAHDCSAGQILGRAQFDNLGHAAGQIQGGCCDRLSGSTPP